MYILLVRVFALLELLLHAEHVLTLSQGGGSSKLLASLRYVMSQLRRVIVAPFLDLHVGWVSGLANSSRSGKMNESLCELLSRVTDLLRRVALAAKDGGMLTDRV